MWVKITRATLTPYNEHSVSSKTHCTNTDLKHAYLAQAAEMNFRKPDFHAHWWCHSIAPVHLPQPGCKSTPPPFFPQAMSELRTHLMIRELIRKRWQWGFTTLNFHQPIFHISPCYPEHGQGHWRGLPLNDETRLLGEEIRAPFAPYSSQQGPRTTPHYKPSYILHSRVRDQECSRIHTLHTDTETYRLLYNKLHYTITVPSPLLAVLSLFCLARRP